MSSRPASDKGPWPHLPELPLVSILLGPVRRPHLGSLTSSPLLPLKLPLKTCSHDPFLNVTASKGTSLVLFPSPSNSTDPPVLTTSWDRFLHKTHERYFLATCLSSQTWIILHEERHGLSLPE